jgi:serine/threonine protein kinase
MIRQLRGLVEALHELHQYGETEPRHGDLAPENILRFRTHTDKSRLGILKFSDLALGTIHSEATDIRESQITIHGTARYRPPEFQVYGSRSRLYDIWSMGCIILEAIIWMLYGHDQIRDLQQSIDRTEFPLKGAYFKVYTPGHRRQVHHTVMSCMTHILSNDPECSQPSAIRDLLTLVKTKLLIVPLPQKRHSYTDFASGSGIGISIRRDNFDEKVGPLRVDATVLLEDLDEIQKKIDGNAAYAFTGRRRDDIRWPNQQTYLIAQDGRLTVPAAGTLMPGLSPRGPQEISKAGLPTKQIVSD